MRGFWSIFKMEIFSTWVSLVPYVCAGSFLLLSSYFFSPLLWISFEDGFLSRWFLDLVLLIQVLCPLLTLFSWSREYREGTIVLLQVSPASEIQIVFAKFSAALFTFSLILLGTFPLPWIVLTSTATAPPVGIVLCAYLGLFLFGAIALAIGQFASSLTENGVLAGFLSFGTIFFFWITGVAAEAIGPRVGIFLEKASLPLHLKPFLRGEIRGEGLYYFPAMVFFFLFLTLRKLEQRRNG